MGAAPVEAVSSFCASQDEESRAYLFDVFVVGLGFGVEVEDVDDKFGEFLVEDFFDLVFGLGVGEGLCECIFLFQNWGVDFH